MAERTPKNCFECVMRHQSTTQNFGTHDKKGKVSVNHPPCRACRWAAAVTGADPQLMQLMEYCNCRAR